jgi:hypothetical protein
MSRQHPLKTREISAQKAHPSGAKGDLSGKGYGLRVWEQDACSTTFLLPDQIEKDLVLLTSLPNYATAEFSAKLPRTRCSAGPLIPYLRSIR